MTTYTLTDALGGSGTLTITNSTTLGQILDWYIPGTEWCDPTWRAALDDAEQLLNALDKNWLGDAKGPARRLGITVKVAS